MLASSDSRVMHDAERLLEKRTIRFTELRLNVDHLASLTGLN
ncbi:hypothetical protein [Marinicrinis sediminis]|uniref:Uncharacterized protein n=1 Tax=Marinicrinis sediminis TaxID=1652465 RepID=A0ABW5RD05_9BACL